MRLDRFLFEQGYAESRQKAKNLIENGNITLDGHTITKPSHEVTEPFPAFEIRGDVLPYVSRGGLKLEAAVRSFSVSCTDKICVDLGASTGGFTDFLLQNGAARVYAVDAGHGQLHPKLATDPRVKSLEGINARSVTREQIGCEDGADLVVMDLSFISQTKIYDAIKMLLRPDGILISLIKPQFEVGREGIGKNGIVRDKAIRRAAVRHVIEKARSHGWHCGGLIRSPITGGDGNLEYLALFGAAVPETAPEITFFDTDSE